MPFAIETILLAILIQQNINGEAAKSEVIWLGTRQQLAKLSQADLTLSCLLYTSDAADE